MPQQTAEADVELPRGYPKRPCMIETHQARSLAETLCGSKKKESRMNLKELTGLLVIAIILVFTSIFIYHYSGNFDHPDRNRIWKEVYDSIDSGKVLILSNEKAKRLIERELSEEKHLSQFVASFRQALKHLAELILVLGICQIAFSIYIYRRNRVKHLTFIWPSVVKKKLLL